MSAAVLQVQDLSFSYPGRHVFSAWSCRLGPGLHWLRGSNGSGKSTLLKLLAGALPPLLGQVEVNGANLSRQGLAYRREVFWCGPGGVAFDHLGPLEYFAFLRGLYPSGDEALLQEQVRGFGLSPFLGQPLRALSTGTQRKVWLAAALSIGTPLVLMDEPLNALDAASLAHLQSQLVRCAASASQAWLVASHEALGPDLPLASVIDLTSA